MKILVPQGLPSYFAFQAFHKLMLGLKMLPMYIGESYEEFYTKIDKMPSEDQEKMIREAVLFVPLDHEEIYSLAQFACDKNGVPYSPINMKSLPAEDIFEILVNVAKEMIKIKVKFVSETEKKN
jgi:hypothetical protein